MTPNTDSDLPELSVPLARTPQAEHRRNTFTHPVLFAGALAFLASKAVSYGRLGELAGIALGLISGFIFFKAAWHSEFILPATWRALRSRRHDLPRL